MCCTSHTQSFSRPFFLFDDRCFNVVEDERPVEDDEEEDDEIFSSNAFNSQTHTVGSSSKSK